MYENDIKSIKLAQAGSSIEMEKLIQYNNRINMEHCKKIFRKRA